MPPMIKIITIKPYVFSASASLSIFAYNSMCVQQAKININYQVVWAPSNQIFGIQFKCIGTVFMTKQNLQIKYSSDYYLLKILQEAMYLASPTWTKSLTKFNPRIKILNMFWTLSVSKWKTHQLDFFQLAFKS